jgi:hypothetical protein
MYQGVLVIGSNGLLTTLISIEVPHSGIRAARPKQYAHDDNESGDDEAHQGPNQLRDPEACGGVVSLVSVENAWSGSSRLGFLTLDHSPEEEQHIDLEGPDEDDVGRHTSAEPFRDPNVWLGLIS